MTLRRGIIVIALLFLCGTEPVAKPPQYIGGLLSGIIRSDSGIVDNASVALFDLNSGAMSGPENVALSDATGKYVFPVSVPGSYRIRVNHSGYATAMYDVFLTSEKPQAVHDISLSRTRGLVASKFARVKIFYTTDRARLEHAKFA